MKKLLCAALCVIMLFSMAACWAEQWPEVPPGPTDTAQVTAALEQRGGYAIHTAVLYSGSDGSTGWQVTLDYLRQSLVVDLDAEAVDADNGSDLAAYDVIYLDESLLSSPSLGEICQAVEDYTSNGGAVLAPNGFYAAFSPEYFGASSFEKIEGYPAELTLTEGLGDLDDLQTVIADFHLLYGIFTDAEELQARDYGYAMAADTAIPLVKCDGQTLYAMNRYGDGYVLFVNPLLPNSFVQSSFSMTAWEENQTTFANTVASCNQLLVNEWAAYISKQIYGFSLDRVFGYYGTPSMSWQLHYEEITGIKNDSLRIFSELCEQFLQVPSFTLIRNSYWWATRMEGMTYLLNQGDSGTLDFQMDYSESAYSSGTHIDSGGQWLSQEWLESGGTYFVDYPEQTQRLYPCAADHDGDGLADFFCGSIDGRVYYYKNLGFTGLDGRLKVSEAQTVTDGDGAPLSVGSYSAPQVMDVDGDGVQDLIVGGPNGEVRWYQGNGSLSFADQGILIQTSFSGQSLPAVGDVDGDGVTDLLVGSDQGLLVLYYGVKEGSATVFSRDRMRDYSDDCADWELGQWLSPALADHDGDGVLDILLGSFEGYISRLHGEGGGTFSFEGYIDSREQNFRGNHHLKFGTYCTPVLCDLDGDGALDLLAGNLEYGLAYPIDSSYFPYREQLQAQVDYVKDHHYYMGVHFYTNSGASAEREAFELAVHREALAQYGLSTDGVGANQHTWYTSSLGTAQTMQSLYRAGLLWESGFGPSGDQSPMPQYKAENVIAYPFFLRDGDESTLLVQGNSVLPYLGAEWWDLSGKYQMPVCVYYHCDMIYRSSEEALNCLQQTSDFQWKHGYNFNKEDQLMLGSAAAYNLSVEVTAGDNGFTIVPGHVSEDFALYDEVAQNASGLRVDLSDSLKASLTSDARVWKQTDGGLTIGLDGPVTLTFTGSLKETAHLEQVNIPADISTDGNGAEISFLGDGMMQVVVFGTDAATSDEGWSVTTNGNETIFTKYGGADTLHIQYLGD